MADIDPSDTDSMSSLVSSSEDAANANPEESEDSPDDSVYNAALAQEWLKLMVMKGKGKGKGKKGDGHGKKGRQGGT